MMIATSYRMKDFWEIAFLEGIIAFAVSLFLLLQRTRSASFLLQMLAVYLLGSGLCKMLAFLYDRARHGLWIRLTGSLFFISAGIVAFLYPRLRIPLTVGDMALLMSVLCISGGALLIAWSANRQGPEAESWTPVSAFLGLILGVLLFSAPLVTLPAFSFVSAGILLIAALVFFGISLGMRRYAGRIERGPGSTIAARDHIHAGDSLQ